MKEILTAAPITYVKWDMNRNMTEIGSAALDAGRQSETVHRYIAWTLRVHGAVDRRISVYPF